MWWSTYRFCWNLCILVPCARGDEISVFSTSDISYQMCYCCRKLDFMTKLGRPWEAVLLSLAQTDLIILQSQSEGSTASQIWESDRPLTHTGWCCHPRGRLTDFTAKRIASAGRVRSDSHAHGLSDLRGRISEIRPLIASASQNLSCDLSEPIRGARPLTHTASHAHAHGLSDLWGRGSPRCRSASHAHRAMQSDPQGRLTDFTAKRIASAGRVRSVCVRGRVRERPWESESHVICQRVHTDRTLWQIWLSDRSDRLDWS